MLGLKTSLWRGLALLALGTAMVACGDVADAPSPDETNAPDSTPRASVVEDPPAKPSAADPAESGPFDGEWKFTNPEVSSPIDFVICEAGCFEIFGSQSNVLGGDGTLVVTGEGVQMTGVQMSINCAGGGSMTGNWDMFLRADGPDRLVAEAIAMPGDLCFGEGPTPVTFVAVRQ
ncbi:MAG TPA: hypothetical protein VI277_09865 [Candidatus Limnocylindria bacterium]